MWYVYDAYFSDAEDKADIVAEMASQWFPSFSITVGIGYWQGGRERMVHLTYMSPIDVEESFTRMAIDIGKALEQNAVLVSTGQRAVNLLNIKDL